MAKKEAVYYMGFGEACRVLEPAWERYGNVYAMRKQKKFVRKGELAD